MYDPAGVDKFVDLQAINIRPLRGHFLILIRIMMPEASHVCRLEIAEKIDTVGVGHRMDNEWIKK